MTGDEATQLVRRIEASWPDARWTDDVRQQWADELLYLDPGPTGTALVRLRRTEDKRPSMAKFREAYKALHTPSHDDRKHCDQCDGNGWIETDNGVAPCRCGRVNTGAALAAVKANVIPPRTPQLDNRTLGAEENQVWAELGRQALEQAAAGKKLPTEDQW